MTSIIFEHNFLHLAKYCTQTAPVVKKMCITALCRMLLADFINASGAL
jgi:hypothetical protein